MKTTDTENKELDWREQLHHLPRGERSTPAWVRWLLYAPFFFVAGAGVILLGVPLGMALRIPPENDGSVMTMIVLGMILNLLLGSVLIMIGPRRGYPPASCRIAFHLFTSPVWASIIMSLCLRK